MAPLPPGAPIGLYLHIPFCAHICPYCDFNTYAGQGELIPRYVDALVREISSPHPPPPSLVRERGGAGAHHRSSPRPRTGEGWRDSAGVRAVRAAATIYLGGGTPSLLPPTDVARLIRACRDAFDVLPDAEITMEANPNSVDAAYFAGLLDAGVNRLSLGVQTLHRRGLRTLGRQHEATDAEAAFRAARSAGFANINLDLIFGWPDQTVDAWERDLTTILGWNSPPEHLSLYSLIVEPGTPMADAVARGILTVLDDDQTADLYETAITRLDAAGWTHYEVANWARDPSLVSRHNAIYWRNGEYAGFGAGAHGRIGSRRTMNHLLPAAYIAAMEAGESPVSNVEDLPEHIQMAETMMLGLRLLHEGIDRAAFAARHGRPLNDVYGPIIAELSRLGLLDVDAERVRLTHHGLMLANDVCARFL